MGPTLNPLLLHFLYYFYTTSKHFNTLQNTMAPSKIPRVEYCVYTTRSPPFARAAKPKFDKPVSLSIDPPCADRLRNQCKSSNCAAAAVQNWYRYGLDTSILNNDDRCCWVCGVKNLTGRHQQLAPSETKYLHVLLNLLEEIRCAAAPCSDH